MGVNVRQVSSVSLEGQFGLQNLLVANAESSQGRKSNEAFLSREKRIYYLDPEGEPAITIDSGEELMVETWDAFEGLRDPVQLDAKALKGPATGPIYVNGAEPGDALKVEFLKITPKEGPAHMVMPGRGFLEEEFTEGYPDRNGP